MTADQRLDQLEPVLSEAITVLDRHTFQLKQLNTAVGTLTGLMTKQSDNISFLLAENVHIKERLTRIESDVAELKSDVAELKSDVAGLKSDVAELKSDVAELKHSQINISSKLDLILSKLQ